MHFHDLRHFGGVMAALTGATTRELMDRLGHSTATAATRYQHVAAGRADALAERLSALACGSPEIVEGFLCRFRLGLGFPDLVVDGR